MLVLEGHGLVQCSLVGRDPTGQPRQAEHYRLMLVVELNAAQAAQVEFDLPADPQDPRLLFVRLDAAGSTLGTLTEGDESGERIAARRAAPADAPELHAVEIERQSQGWFILVDGKPLGSLPLLRPGPAPGFRLRAEGGPAWFLRPDVRGAPAGRGKLLDLRR